MTMQQARSLVMTWQAAQKDESEGKCDAKAEMRAYLDAFGRDGTRLIENLDFVV